MVAFDVLGPLRVRFDDGTAWMPAGRQADLLGLLIVHDRRPVAGDRLIDALWGSRPDDRALHRLQNQVHRLRRALGHGAPIVSEASGYRLEAPQESLDSTQLTQLIEEAHEAANGDPGHAVELLRKALALWRGRPFLGLEHADVTAQAERLEETRRQAAEELHRLHLTLGRVDTVIAEVPQLLREHPLRERLYEIQATAQALAGRRAEALATCRTARAVLRSELGIRPGPRLRELEQDVLDGEELSAVSGRGSPAGEPSPSGPPAPRQLPGPPPLLHGRDQELDRLDEFLNTSEAGLLAITGVGGVGKTALARCWAHRIAHDHPDGQLHADLGGGAPGGPTPPGRVLGTFLRAVGLDSGDMPAGVDERAALFRSHAAGRRMLILLDDAADPEQVRPLLPGSDTSQVVITSRDALGGLAVTDGAHRLHLRPLDQDGARALLRDHLEGGSGQRPVRLEELVSACGGLPLALTLAADRARAGTPETVDDLLAEFRTPEGRLRALSSDAGGSLREVLASCTSRLDADAHLVLRRLATQPGQGHDERSVRAVSGLARTAARRAAETLVRAHLVERRRGGGLHLHDLVRAHARELAAAADGPRVIQEAFADWCTQQLRTARSAQAMVTPVDHVDAGTLVPLFADRASAAQWLAEAMENLVLGAEHAAVHGPVEFAPLLSSYLRRHLDENHRHDDMERLHRAALHAARVQGSRRAEEAALHDLGILELRRGRLDESQRHFQEALEIAEEIGEPGRRAGTLNFLAGAYAAAQDLPAAVHHLQEAAALLRALDAPSIVHPLTNLASVHRWTGRPRIAIGLLREAMGRAGRAEPRARERYQLGALSESVPVLVALGSPEEALEAADRALSLAEQWGRAPKATSVRAWKGTALAQLGQAEEAAEELRRALEEAERHRAPLGLATAHNGLAEVLREQGRMVQARAHHVEGLTHAGVAWEEKLRAHRGLAETSRLLGLVAEADEQLRQAVRLSVSVDHHDADALAGLLSEQ